MDINSFVSKVEEQYTEVTSGSFSPNTNFKDQAEWGSLTALMIVAMVDQEYEKRLTGDMIESSKTIEDLFNHLTK